MSNHQIRLAGPWTLRAFRNGHPISTHVQPLDRIDVRETPWESLELTRRFNWVSEETNIQIRLTFRAHLNPGSLTVNEVPIPLRSLVADEGHYQIESHSFEQHLWQGQNQLTLVFERIESPIHDARPNFFVSVPVLAISTQGV